LAIVDGGTTATQLVRHLPRDIRATIATHSPTIAVELADHPGIDVILLGGRLFKHSMVAVGAATIAAAAHLRPDIYFMGVTGVHAQAGFSTGDFEEAAVKRTLAEQSAETYVLASAEKINSASRFKVGDLCMATAMVVERDVPDEQLMAIVAGGLALVRAD
jgi:DeoR/GlpR family transcriptional regulator of sugar metabolism